MSGLNRQAGEEPSMILHFPRLYNHERRAEPCFISLPFTQGAFPKQKQVHIIDQGVELFSQSRALATYPDGSVKYLFVRFQADLPANRGKDLDIQISDRPLPEMNGIRITREGNLLRVDGGSEGLTFTLHEGSASLMDSLCDGRKTYTKDQFVGPVLENTEGRRFLPVYSTWRVDEEGPLVAVIRGDGVLEEIPSRPEQLRFETKLTVYAHKPWMEVSFRLINTTSDTLTIKSFVFSLARKNSEPAGTPAQPSVASAPAKGDSLGESSVAAGRVLQEDGIYQTTGVKLLGAIEEAFAASPVRCCAASSNYKTNFMVSSGKSVEKHVDTASLMAEANEHFTEVFYGTFFADCTEPDGGVCLTAFQAQQNYPKAIRCDENGICLMLVPEGPDTVVFESGMSREQRFQLHFHDALEHLSEIDRRSLLYQMPDRPFLDPETWRDAGVCPDIFVKEEQADPDIEMALINLCDAHSRSFGMLNFGDAPDPNYTRQGRGKGMLVWTNNEYDFPHACALMYMRTGERRFMDYLIASACHWMDVDVCHYSTNPLFQGGQWEHCRRHVLDSAIVCSHEWVEGLLDLYHLTGDNRALETALGIGENVRRLLETPAYQTHGESNARETGWALRSLTALFVETGDPKWVEKADWIVDQFRAWMDDYGSWVAPYTDNTLIHVPFMIAVAMGSLYRYYEVFPKDAVRKMLLDAADDLVQNCMTKNGLFIYKELPSLNRLGNNTLVLEALTIAWKLSGDEKYLRLGLPTFRRDFRAPVHVVGKKTVIEGTVLLENEPPKSFAQSFIPLSVFYKAASDAGLLASPRA